MFINPQSIKITGIFEYRANRNFHAMTIFITGIAGFIGFHLATALAKANRRVVGIDLFNDYYDVNLKKARAAQLKALGIEVIQADIRDTGLIKQLFTEHDVSKCVHLAAQAGVRYSLTHPYAYVESNLDGFVHILEAIRSFPKVKLIYASSSSVYGNGPVPFSEKACTTKPLNLYGATKQANEAMAYAYHHMFGISAIGLRYFTVYGPWGRPDMAYYTFTKGIVEQKPLKVYGDGTMRRDFTYIDDIIAGTIAALDSPYICDVFNLGNQHPHTVLELIQVLEQVIGKQAIVTYLPNPNGEAVATYADISKSQQMLQFNPKTPFEVGLSHFFNWYSAFS